MAYNDSVNIIAVYTRILVLATGLLPFVVAVGAGVDPDKEILAKGLFIVEYPSGQEAVAERTLSILANAIRVYNPVLPAGDAPIRVVVTDVPAEFERYAVHFAGLDVTGLAQPGSDLIIVKAPRLRPPGGDYPGTLRHELVHLLLYRNIDYANLPQWLNEGLAMSLSNEFYWQSLFKVASMFVNNRIIPYRLLDNSFYSPSDQMQFNDAYAQSLSMTRHLRDLLGEERFWQLIHALAEKPFPKALSDIAGMTVLEFWGGYERALWKYALIAAMASGFFFQPAAILLIIAYIRRRRIAQNLYRRWEMEEAAEEAGGGVLRDWDELVEDPDAWKQGAYDDDDDQW